MGSQDPLPSASISITPPQWSIYGLGGDHDESSSKIFTRKCQFWWSHQWSGHSISANNDDRVEIKVAFESYDKMQP